MAEPTAEERHTTPDVPEIRIRVLRDEPVRPRGELVLYWMTAARRPGWSFALDRAVAWARALERPLVVLEALGASYPWASDRLHAFVLEGMAANARAFAKTRALYYPYVEPHAGAGKGLVAALSERAAVVVADDFPGFTLPRLLARAAEQASGRLEAVDSNGLLPLRAAEKVYNTAVEFRRFLQRTLPEHLARFPRERPLARAELPGLERLPRAIERRWPRAEDELLAAEARPLAALPIDHSVPPVPGVRGGFDAAARVLAEFLESRLARYGDRGDPTVETTSLLSPWLHFGHASAHQVFAALAAREGWTREKLAARATGRRAGFWGMSERAEAFLDELVTWRELGLNMSSKRPDEYDRWESLPAWARATLEEHARDRRPHVYSRAELEDARTHDALWNAAQTQLRREGRIHGYLRMLWGKKVLEWSRTPREALEALVALNDKHALDGRDPNSVSGIFWCFGRYDRPWGPERKIFGKVRFMSSENTAKKFHVAGYLARHAPHAPDTGRDAERTRTRRTRA